MEGLIDEGLRAVFANKPIPAGMKTAVHQLRRGGFLQRPPAPAAVKTNFKPRMDTDEHG